jgi:hypothetical protein
MTQTHRQAKSIFLLAALSLGLLGLAAGSPANWAELAQAKQEQVDEKTIRDLIQQLGDESFEKREDATKRLAGIGEPAIDLLQQAAKDNPDAEIRQRAGELANSMDNKFFAVVETFKPKVDLGPPRPTRLALMPDGKQIVVASKGPPFVWDSATRKESDPVDGTRNYT